MPRGKKSNKDKQPSVMAEQPKQSKPKSASESEREAMAYVDALKKAGKIGDITKKINFIPTGSWVINRLIGDGTHQNKPGGIPRGYITEIYGDEATGKTTLGLHITKECQDMGGRVLYADFEQSLRAQFQYVKNIGIDLSPYKFLYLPCTTLEDGAKEMAEALIKFKPWLIIIDSVTAMMPKQSMEKDPEDPTAIGLQARLVGHTLSWFSKRLPKHDCALVLINQKRSVIKMSKYAEGPNTVTSGGRAVRFFTTLRIHLKSTGKKEEIASKSLITGLDEKKLVNQEVKVVMDKNKLDMPYKSGPIYVEFGQGIDNIMSLISLGVNKKVIKKSGGQYSWSDPNSDLSFSIIGKNALKKYLESNEKILEALQPYLMPTQDFQEMDDIQKELEAKGIENLSMEEKEQLFEIRKNKGLPTDDLYSEEELADMESIKELTSKMGSDKEEEGEEGEETVSDD